MNLSRELNLEEIASLSQVAHQHHLLSEVFVHGSYCISFSGLCYMSSVHGGNSGNRGRCSQPCRDRYQTTPAGKQYPLNLKDNSAWSDLKEIAEAGVDSIKIEGRIKKFHYVYTVVESYKIQLQRLYEGKRLSVDNERLFKVFNRDFSTGYLKGDITRDMFIENPRDHSATHLAALSGGSSDKAIEDAENDIYVEKSGIRTYVKSITDRLSTGKVPLTMILSGKEGEVLKMEIITPESTFSLISELNLMSHEKMALNRREVEKRFKALNETAYFIEKVDLEDLQTGLFIPFSELTKLKKRILFFLRDSREHVDPVILPALPGTKPKITPPVLSVLISSVEDLHLCENTDAEFFFQIPDSIADKQADYIDIFKRYRSIQPWFPAVLIGEDFNDAKHLLQALKPGQIVTDNTGIGYEASRLGIPWIAGPRLNLVNSYSLLTLKENFDCAGAFISNELKKQQIRGIRKPADFDLYYSIYHPIELMTSRQCFFQQVTGCEKETVDRTCIRSCHKSASIRNLKEVSLFIHKEKGCYNRIYNETNYLNTDTASDFPGLFSAFLIDLRDIETLTRTTKDKLETIKRFENLIKGIPGAAEELKDAIAPASCSQYAVGI